jgi:N-acetylneuraminic acid mutarotase
MKLKLIALTLGVLSCIVWTGCDDDESPKPPAITSVSPESGLEGVVVTITGTNFSATPANNIVTFNGVAAEVSAATVTSITTTVPNGATTGKIAVTVNGKTATSQNNFVVTFLPTISSFSPTSEYADGSVTITGANFSAVQSENVVKFNGTTATVTNASTTSITATVPAGATTGSIEVIVNGNSVLSANNFVRLYPPVINSFDPASGLPATSTGFAGATITINGNYFSNVASENSVKFNATAATVLTASATQLTVEVPSGASTGKISVTVNSREALSANDFSVSPTNLWLSVNSTHDALLRTSSVAFVIGTKIYFGLGQNASNADLKDFWEYDTQTDQFTRKKDFEGVERNGATAFTIGNRGYVCTGFHTGTAYQDLWEYDPATDDWTQRANFPGAPRSGAVSFGIGTKGYVGTGYASLNYFADFWEFDPSGGTNGSGSWVQKADVGVGVPGRQGPARFVVNEKGYVGGGYANGNRKDFWGLAADQWTATAEPNVPTFVTSTFSFGIGSKGFVKIGSDLWMYDPSTNEWTKKASPPAINGVGVSVGNVGYTVGGSSSVKNFYKYIPN